MTFLVVSKPQGVGYGVICDLPCCFKTSRIKTIESAGKNSEPFHQVSAGSFHHRRLECFCVANRTYA